MICAKCGVPYGEHRLTGDCSTSLFAPIGEDFDGVWARALALRYANDVHAEMRGRFCRIVENWGKTAGHNVSDLVQSMRRVAFNRSETPRAVPEAKTA